MTLWTDTYNAPESEADPALDALLAMMKPEVRQLAEPMMRGYFAQIRAQLSPDDYQTYCASLKRAYEAHKAGDHDTARQIVEAYGLSYDQMAMALA